MSTQPLVPANTNALTPLQARLLEVARGADPHHWRDRFRQPDAWADQTRLKVLAEVARASEPSPDGHEQLHAPSGPEFSSPPMFRWGPLDVLEELGRREKRPFPTVWEFVDWAQARESSLDLSSPPRPEEEE